jgi:hypothetical protein
MTPQKNKEIQRATVQTPAWIVEEGCFFIQEVKIVGESAKMYSLWMPSSTNQSGGFIYQSKKDRVFTDKRAAVDAFIKMMDEVIEESEKVIKQAKGKIKQYKKELKDDAATS